MEDIHSCSVLIVSILVNGVDYILNLIVPDIKTLILPRIKYHS